jgi:hypothetical protein
MTVARDDRDTVNPSLQGQDKIQSHNTNPLTLSEVLALDAT